MAADFGGGDADICRFHDSTRREGCRGRQTRLRRHLLARTALATGLLASVLSIDTAEAQVIVAPPPFANLTFNNSTDCTLPLLGSCVIIESVLPGESINLTNSGDFTTLGLRASLPKQFLAAGLRSITPATSRRPVPLARASTPTPF